MIKSRSITVLCCCITVIAIVFTCLFVSGRLTFVKADSSNDSFRYADKLFDTSYVHSINIDVSSDDWQNMLDNARAEEYISCDVTIDGTTIKNVGIRPKGNTSLSNVESMDSERYSFKIKFDKYDDGKNYMGLDKIALNNIIQDNTYMKDYFSYRMMGEAGADAPLCSYSYIKVNNQDWGLYLTVEAIDESFARRNYGSDFGELYKPESMAMGGGMDKDSKNLGGRPEMPPQDRDEQESPQGADRQGFQQGEAGQKPPGDASEELKGDMTEIPPQNGDGQEPPQTFDGREHREDKGGFGAMGDNTVALVYQDDDIDSYSAIFDYAVFNPDTSDKIRLINSIKQLNEGNNLQDVVDVDEVLKYFAAHNFTVNFDSYTGSMMHNYYLYEKDGKMSMIPWDYNLAFGSFSGGHGGGRRGADNADSMDSGDSATQSVNYPIDMPVSGTTLEDRPMIGKLLENSEYMEKYHEVFSDFIEDYFESGDFLSEYNRVYNMIAEYVMKDPTKFCTFDEFTKGAEALKQFCELRAESVRGQLNGMIPSTTEGQAEDSGALIDASSVSINDMGSMGMGGGQPGGGESEGFERGGRPNNFEERENPVSIGNDIKVREYAILIGCILAVAAAIIAAAIFKRRRY